MWYIEYHGSVEADHLWSVGGDFGILVMIGGTFLIKSKVALLSVSFVTFCVCLKKKEMSL